MNWILIDYYKFHERSIPNAQNDQEFATETSKRLHDSTKTIYRTKPTFRRLAKMQFITEVKSDSSMHSQKCSKTCMTEFWLSSMYFFCISDVFETPMRSEWCYESKEARFFAQKSCWFCCCCWFHELVPSTHRKRFGNTTKGVNTLLPRARKSSSCKTRWLLQN